jgi:GT2 family glycosyltransferase/SAM-dependent methyltransferase
MRKHRKIGLICPPGSDIPEMTQLLEDYPSFLITYSSPAWSNQKNVYYLRNMAKNPFGLIAGVLNILLILWKEKPNVLLGAGSEIAIPAFYFAKLLLRAKLVYLEWNARGDRPSLTGRLVYPISDLFHVMQEPLMKWYGSRASHVRAPSLLWEISDLISPGAGESLRMRKEFVPQPAEINSPDRIDGLEFRSFAEPTVSIIIPVHNQWEYTYHCLQSVLKNTDQAISYEIIVADDRSTDQTSEMLEKVKGIRTIVNQGSPGFLRNCNNAAKDAKGQYIVFLNNDTTVTEGWLRGLVETAAIDPRVGLVGAKLIFPDGTIQEAGGIIWNDKEHTAWNHGRNDDPGKYEYNYLKEADYCSAACILIRKEIFDRLKGFDERYAFAYYEDADLAFSMRKMGFKVVFQPRCRVIHFEGASHGKELSDEGKKYQLVNQKIFYEKWRETLEAGHFKVGENLFLARDRSQRKKVMLFVDHYVPTYDKDAGSYITYEYLKIFLGMNFKVIFWPNNLGKSDPYTSDLQQMGIEVVYGLHSFRKYIGKYGQYIDVAVLSRPDIAINYIDLLKNWSNIKIVYIPVDLHFLRKQREAVLKGNPDLFREVEMWRSREFYLMEKSDVTWVYSTAEKEVLEKENPNIKAEVPPWIQSVHTAGKGFREKEGLVFIAGFAHPPNEDGILWFAADVFPRIKEKIPDIKLTILGSNPTERVQKLNSENIRVVGFVKDPSSYFYEAKVFVSPLRFGAGVKGKVLNAMSYGLPVVSTSIGIEGMGLEAGQDVLVADDAEGFAGKVAEVYQDEELWRRLSENSLIRIGRDFSAEGAKKRFEEMFNVLHTSRREKGAAEGAERTLRYEGHCTVCGNSTEFKKNSDNLRETFTCPHCGSISRNRHLAKILCRRIGGEGTRSLADWVIRSPGIRVYEAQASGAIHNVLKRLKGYVCSEFLPEVTPGSSKNDIRCEDLERLSFPDRSFDVVITQDVFEHIRDPWAAFKEVHRILKHPGCHVFTIPYHKGLKTARRIEIEGDREVYLLPKVHHGDGIRDGLVYTDFGDDIVDALNRIGFLTEIVWADDSDRDENQIHWSVIFVSRKKENQ